MERPTRRLGRLALSLAVLWLAAAAASAQVETDTRSRASRPAAAQISGDSPLSGPDQANATMRAYSTCLAERDAAEIKRVLARPEPKPDASRALVNLADADCLEGGDLRMPAGLFRGSLFAALYRLEFAAKSTGLGAKPLDFRADVTGVGPEMQRYLALETFGDCVVRADPGHARSLILAPVASTGERAAFAGLSPAMNGCLFAGSTLHFSKPILEGLFAESLYREALAWREAPAAP